MITSTLIEIVLKGLFSTVNLSFLKRQLDKAKEVRFNSPQLPQVSTFDEVAEVFQQNTYVDLVITTDKFCIDDRMVKNTFINLGRNDNDVELLLYFDLKDFDVDYDRLSIDYLKSWVDRFARQYNFEYFIAQMDNAGEDEYYFDKNGFGPLYISI